MMWELITYLPLLNLSSQLQEVDYSPEGSYWPVSETPTMEIQEFTLTSKISLRIDWSQIYKIYTCHQMYARKIVWMV